VHQETRRAFCRRVLIWGCFNKRGLGCFRAINGTMNTERYVSVIENELLPSVYLWFNGPTDCIFQHDNAPCHKSKVTNDFLSEKEFVVMDWPPFSLDLNPIENLWSILKQRLTQTTFNSAEEVVEEVYRLWNSDPILNSHCAKLSDSMPQRIQSCIVLRGGATKY
jgi:transposase